MTAATEGGHPGNARRRGGSLLALAAFSAALFVAVYLVFVRTDWGQRLDDAALAGRGRQPPQVVHGVLDLLATIDLGSLVVALLAIIAVAYRYGRGRRAVAAGLVVLGAVVSAEALKRLVLGRPMLLDHPDPFGARNSLPSGHAAVAMAVAMALVLAMPSASRGPVAVITGTYAVAVGGAAITAGWHRPSDVVAAYLVVTVWAAAAAAGLARVPGTEGTPVPEARPDDRRLPRGGDRWPTSRLALLGAALAGLLAILIARGWGDLADAVPDGAYAVGVAGSVASGLVLLATFTRLLCGADHDPPTAVDDRD